MSKEETLSIYESVQGEEEVVVQQFTCGNRACGRCSYKFILSNSPNEHYDFDIYDIVDYPSEENALAELPSYVPQVVRQDYREAYLIRKLSPKASATLARRCLQGMIRDFWNVSKDRLVDEIKAIEKEVNADALKALHSLRQIANIGAHPEEDVNVIIDVEPDAAEKLLKLIEFLIAKWYTAREEEKQLFQDIQTIADDKKKEKKAAKSQQPASVP